MKPIKFPRAHIGLSLNTKLECPFMRLSVDLILNILFRVPVKSLGTCKLVCKTLNSLISDPKFAIDHLKLWNQTNAPLTLVLQKNNVVSKLELEDYMDINKGVRLVGVEHQLDARGRVNCTSFLIGSCHGLVGFYLRSNVLINADFMFICNLLTGKLIRIAQPKQRVGARCYVREDACWFGYLPSINEYKIFLSYVMDELHLGHRLYVYSFSIRTWREICVTDEVSSCFALGLNTVFLNEALHCLSEGQWVCKFDLVKETFERIPFAIDEPNRRKNWSLGVIGKYDSLCVVCVYRHIMVYSGRDEEEEEAPMTLEVWMLEDYDNFNSWKKWCRVDLKGEINFRYWIKFLGFINGSFLSFQGEYGLIIIDPMNAPPTYAIFHINGTERVRNMSNYVESLISPANLP